MGDLGAGAELVNNELCLASGAFFRIFISEWLALAWIHRSRVFGTTLNGNIVAGP